MVRAGLTRTAVIDAAAALVAGEGLNALTMRRLAADLDVEAMSLYNHVDNKADLHTGLVDHLWDLVDHADDEPDWRVGLERLAVSAHDVLVANSWFFDLPVTMGGLPRIRVINAQLGHMRRAGISADVAFHAHHIIDGHIYGHAWQVNEFRDNSELAAHAEQMLREVDSNEMPWLMEHVAQHMGVIQPGGDGFLIGLRYILDGISTANEATQGREIVGTT